MKLIIGLGNPGTQYRHTRHNVGFLVLDELARRHQLMFKERKTLQAESTEGKINGTQVRLLKPLTFMNRSGEAVKAAMKKDKVKVANLLVVYDDADMAFGEIRFRDSGRSGGHNGVQSILESLPKDAELARVKVGIGRSENPNIPLDAWVLSKWTKEESEKLPAIISAAADRVEEWVSKA